MESRDVDQLIAALHMAIYHVPYRPAAATPQPISRARVVELEAAHA
jgi:hypothetical protein